MKLKKLLCLLLCSASIALASQSDQAWIKKLDVQEQKIAIFMLRNRFNAHIAKVIGPNMKTNEDYAWMLKINQFGSYYLSELSTKNRILQKTIMQEYQLYSNLLNGKVSEEKFRKDQLILFARTTKKFKYISKNEASIFFKKYSSKLDKTYIDLLGGSKLYATKSFAKKTNNQTSAKQIAKFLQKMIDDNNGRIKVINATYMDRVISLENIVTLYYTLEEDELIKYVMIERNIDKYTATMLAKSQEFVNNMKREQSKSFHNAWCNNEAYKKVFKEGIEFSIHMYWSDRRPIINDLRVSEASCKKNG